MRTLKQKIRDTWHGWKNGLVIRYHEACPCLHTAPCSPNCTCVHGGSSRGCSRCCSYGSNEQQQRKAEWLARQIDSGREIASIAAELRHLYHNMVTGAVADTESVAKGLLGPQIERLEKL